MRSTAYLCLAFVLSLTAACGSDDDDGMPNMTGSPARDPNTAPVVMVDRFSASAGMLQVRSADNGLPGPNEAVDFDTGPFITQGFGPHGEIIKYYNFDVQPLAPAPIYALFHADGSPVAGQLNIIDVLPGDAGYNDFWQVMKVTVPADYIANSVTSAAEVRAAGYAVESTDTLVNCPVVPQGSSAKLRLNGESTALTRGWYRDEVVYYLNFLEAPLSASAGKVPTAPIYVTFTVNPDPKNPASGPASGFAMENASLQTHNVAAALPDDDGYSPLWAVAIYDNADFDAVMDLASLETAHLLEPNGPKVNCPIVSVE
jgi:hypothetical protein